MSMFSKANPDPAPGAGPRPLSPSDPAFAGAPAPRAPPAASGGGGSSVLGPDLNIRGGIEGRGEIQLQGRAWGDVKVERLIVAEPAELEGSVAANVVEVRGRVKGAIEAHSVRLLASARVEGDITYETLEIEAGAQFEGRCVRAASSQAKPEVPPPAASKPPPAPDQT